MEDLVGKVLDGSYRIDKLLGQGGMGAVFKARDIALDRDVAIKIMHAHIARQEGFRDRFLQEARAAAALEHPGIVRVHAFSHNPEALYIVMAFLTGQNLRDWLAQLAQKGMIIALPESLAIVELVADALAYAHRRGVYHRDIKPGNIILRPLDPGQHSDVGLSFQPVVTDFGLAKLAEGGVMSITGMAMGTPAYMAPEQCEGREVDGRADIYALGIVLYELVLGRVPFNVKTLTEALHAHTQEPPPPPRTIMPDLPSQIEEIILRAVAKKPEERYQTGSDLARALNVARQALPKPVQADETATKAGQVSLATMISQEVPIAEPAKDAWPTPPVAIPAGGRVVIMGPGGETRAVVLGERRQLSIGRDEGNDVLLPDAKASRHHAQITVEGDKFRIADLNSTNGTFLGTNKLLPGVPENWPVGRTVRIGDHWLRLEVAQAPAAEPSMAASMAAAPAVSVGQAILVALEPAELSVRPGESVNLVARVLNKQPQVDHFDASVEGIPEAWVKRPDALLRLAPGDTGTLILRLAPPQSPESHAGEHALVLKVSSHADPSRSAQASGKLQVEPFRGTRLELAPSVLANAGQGSLHLANLGNAPETYALGVADPSGALDIKPNTNEVMLDAGKSQNIALSVRSRARRPLMGNPQTYPFTVTATAKGGEVSSAQGTLTVKPYLPAWAVPLLTTLALLLCAGSVFAYTEVQKNRAEKATATLVAIANQTAAVTVTAQVRQTETATVLYAAQTATAGAMTAAQAQAATAQAQNATAQALGQAQTQTAAVDAQAKLGTTQAVALAQTVTAIVAKGTVGATTSAATRTPTPTPSATVGPTPTNPGPVCRNELAIVSGIIGREPLLIDPGRIGRVATFAVPGKLVTMAPVKPTATPSSQTFQIRVQTGNAPNAGTAANVFINLSGAGGETGWLALKKTGSAGFQANQLDTFSPTTKYIGAINKVCLKRDTTGAEPDWLVAWVEIDDGSGPTKFTFDAWIGTD